MGGARADAGRDGAARRSAVRGDDDRLALAEDRPGRAALFLRRRTQVDDAAVEPHAGPRARRDPHDAEARGHVDGAPGEVDGAPALLGGARRAGRRQEGEGEQQGAQQDAGMKTLAGSGDHGLR